MKKLEKYQDFEKKKKKYIYIYIEHKNNNYTNNSWST